MGGRTVSPVIEGFFTQYGTVQTLESMSMCELTTNTFEKYARNVQTRYKQLYLG